MKTCFRCGSPRTVFVSGKVDDRIYMSNQNGEMDYDEQKKTMVLNGDYLKFTYCTHCGQIQGGWFSTIHKEEEDEW